MRPRTWALWVDVHIWLGWLVGLMLILWTLSGLIMVIKPIEEVRASDLRTEAAPFSAALQITPPRFDGRPVADMRLAMRGARPVWLLKYQGGDMRAADALTGSLLPPLSAIMARQIADGALKKPGKITSVRRFAADANPKELRRDRPAWQVKYADGLHIYVDADSGEVLAVRTPFWRAYDFVWGLHIMDPAGRDDFHHPLIITFAGVSAGAMILGFLMLFIRRSRRKAIFAHRGAARLS